MDKKKNGYFAFDVEKEEIVWVDKKRILGMPISFTKYTASLNKILIKKGFLNIQEDEIVLYRIRDIKYNQSLFQRIFKVGTVTIYSTDVNLPQLELKNVKNAKKVKETLSVCIENNKKKNGIRATEIMTGLDAITDIDGDGIPDHIDGEPLIPTIETDEIN